MNIFLSWSTDYSKKIAQEFRNWIPYVLQDLEPFMSSQDISMGSDWYSDIRHHLTDSTVGIIFLTPDNIDSPWLNFEAGALSASLEPEKKVIPIIFGAENTNTVLSKSPLKHFQSVLYPDKSGIRNLMSGLNNSMPNSLPSDIFETTFEKWWPDLDKKLNELHDTYTSSDQNETKDSNLGSSLNAENSAVLAQIDRKLDLMLRQDPNKNKNSVSVDDQTRLFKNINSVYKELKTMYEDSKDMEENTDSEKLYMMTKSLFVSLMYLKRQINKYDSNEKLPF